MAAQGFEAENRVLDGVPAGGFVHGVGIDIQWQNGPLGRVGTDEREEPNGAFVEDVINAALQRIEHYNDSGFECAENTEAIGHLRLAVEALNRRTQRRTEEGVEGTHEGS